MCNKIVSLKFPFVLFMSAKVILFSNLQLKSDNFLSKTTILNGFVILDDVCFK